MCNKLLKDSSLFLCLLFVLSSFAATSGTAQTVDSVSKILRKIAKASANLPYEAVVNRTYYSAEGDQEFKKRIIKKDKYHIREEYISPDEWVNRVQINKFNQLYSYFTDKDSASVRVINERYKETSFHAESFILLQKNYNIKILNEEKLNGHITQIVKFIPITKDRNKHKLWVGYNGYIHKTELFSPKGELIYKETVEEVVFDSEIKDSNFEITTSKITKIDRDTKQFNSFTDLAREYANTIVVPKTIPTGFLLDKIILIKRKNRSSFVQLFYTDGISSISIFQRKREGSDIKPKLQAGRIKTARVFGLKGNKSISVVGDMPADVLMDIYNQLHELTDEEIKNEDQKMNSFDQ